MSIFKDSFHPSIKDQLATRQTAINNRTSQNLQYYNSRNAWIRLSSSVNVLKKGVEPTEENLKNPDSYDNTLANQYVLQGGALNNNALREGIGENFNFAYSNKAADDKPYRLGIRPMPGITGIEIKSLGAYGSLREATVNFQCWDIKQLEDLELLYMRPGYSLLLEWGWAPYLTNGTEGGNYKDSKLSSIVSYTNIVKNQFTKEQLFGIQYAKSTDGKWKGTDGKQNFPLPAGQGNYDSMFGYVKNYSWKARMDGGYDCQTTIISMGEVIESLKINYTPLEANPTIAEYGLISPKIANKNIDVKLMPNLDKMYSQNILAGIFYEMREITKQLSGGFGGFEDTSVEFKIPLTDIKFNFKIPLPQKGSANTDGTSYIAIDKQHECVYNIFRRTVNIKGGESEASGTGTIGQSDEQIYITLETLCLLLNNYVLLRDKNAKKPFASISVYEKNISSIDSTTGDGYLLALAHPLQVSVDPTVCLIKSPLWISGIKVAPPSGSTDTNTGEPIVKFNSNFANADTLVDSLIALATATDLYNTPNPEFLANWIKDLIQGPPGNRYSKEQILENVKELSSIYAKKYNDSNYKIKKPYPPDVARFSGTIILDEKFWKDKTIKQRYIVPPNTFYDLLNDNYAFNLDRRNKDYSNIPITPDGDTTSSAKDAADSDPAEKEREKIKEEQEKLNEQAEKAADASKFLANLNQPYFINDSWIEELGIIGNIYVNLNMLYNLSIDDNLEAQDKKEKNEISLYDFIKNVLSRISAATGDVNNFDLFVDPDTSTAKIIDVNYVDRISPTEAYDKAFELQVHNTDSVVRSYSLESKIFPEQSTNIAIGAQTGGGALGVDSTSLVEFNKAIRDRIIPIKDAPTTPEEEDPNTKLKVLTESLGSIYDYFTGLKPGLFSDGNYDVDEAGKYQGALRDLINFFKALGKSKTKNKFLIPTVLSVEMDGIGGIIIGNIFRVPSDILPKGYKGSSSGGIGSKLGYVVTSIGHSIKNNDWTTKLDAQTIILDEPQGLDVSFSDLIITQPPSSDAVDQTGGPVVITPTTTPAGTVTSVNVTSKQVADNAPQPNNVPYSIDKIIETLNKKGYRHFKEPWILNIVGIRSNTKQQGSTATDKFIDYIIMWYYDNKGKRIDAKSIITTTPARSYYIGTASGNFNNMLPNQYKDAYSIGLHKGKYQALILSKLIDISRPTKGKGVYDYSKPSKENPKDNIHKALADTPTISCNKGTRGWSAGCQVFKKVSDFEWMMSAARQQVNNTNKKVFDYTLLKEEDII